MAQFVLKAKDIDVSGRDYALAVPAAWVASALLDSGVSADPAGSTGSLRIRAERSGADLLVRGTLRARVVAECVRCLEGVPVDVDCGVSLLFTARGDAHRPEPDEVELTPEEIDREFYTGDELVLDAIVREHLIVEVPMQPLCSPECPGIEIPAHVRPPADFEASSVDVDPRLAPLKALAGKVRQDKE